MWVMYGKFVSAVLCVWVGCVARVRRGQRVCREVLVADVGWV